MPKRVGQAVAELTPERKSKFLEKLASTGNITEACREIGTTRTTVYKHKQSDPEFAAGWREAQARAVEALELEARRRALEGVDEPVFWKGEECGAVRKYSDTLLIFLLKGLKPGRYRERVEHSGDPKRPMRVKVEEMTDEQLAAFIAASTVAK